MFRKVIWPNITNVLTTTPVLLIVNKFAILNNFNFHYIKFEE